MKLDNFQLAILNKAAESDERVASLLKKYARPHSKFDQEILYLSLLEAFKYWSVAFALGKEEADKLLEAKREAESIEASYLIMKERGLIK